MVGLHLLFDRPPVSVPHVVPVSLVRVGVSPVLGTCSSSITGPSPYTPRSLQLNVVTEVQVVP